jgi:hypothetical protein
MEGSWALAETSGLGKGASEGGYWFHVVYVHCRSHELREAEKKPLGAEGT